MQPDAARAIKGWLKDAGDDGTMSKHYNLIMILTLILTGQRKM